MPQTYIIKDELVSAAQKEEALIVHPHAQRTGGGTMRRLLREVFGQGRVYNRSDSTGAKRWDDLKDRDLIGFRAVADHLDFHDIGLARPCFPLAVLRHPLYRAVSLYYFIQKKKNGHQFQELARATELEDFYVRASAINPVYFRNLQCRRVCGAPDARMALETIGRRYLGVGFTNQLDEFARGLSQRLGWREFSIKSVPPDEERYASLITPKFRDAVLRENTEDLVLFDRMSAGSPYPLPARRPASLLVPLAARLRRTAGRLRRRIAS